MKTIIVVREEMSSKYRNMTDSFRSALKERSIECHLITVNRKAPLHEQFYAIRDHKSQLIITIDLAGFEFRNELEGLSYNNLPCRMAHLLCDKYEVCPAELNMDLNFSMFFYTASKEQAEKIKEKYPNVENVKSMAELVDITNANKNVEKTAKDIIKQILRDTEFVLNESV